MLWWIIAAIAAVGAAYLALVAFGAFKVAPVEAVPASPARDRTEALAKLAALRTLDGSDTAPACASTLLEPDGAVTATIVIYHGFTNCPNQFMQAAEVMRQRGFGDPVAVSGLSGGGVLAAWACVTREDFDRALVVAPAVEPSGIPAPLGRLMTRFRSAIPKYYFWWNPKKKANLGESPYVYPGFPLPGIVPFVHMGLYMADGEMGPGRRPGYAALLSNPGDFAVSAKGAARLFRRVFEPAEGRQVREFAIEKELGWWHDFVDPDGPHHGTNDEVASVWLNALGFGDDAVTAGLMHEVPPKRS